MGGLGSWGSRVLRPGGRPREDVIVPASEMRTDPLIRIKLVSSGETCILSFPHKRNACNTKSAHCRFVVGVRGGNQEGDLDVVDVSILICGCMLPISSFLT